MRALQHQRSLPSHSYFWLCLCDFLVVIKIRPSLILIALNVFLRIFPRFYSISSNPWNIWNNWLFRVQKASTFVKSKPLRSFCQIQFKGLCCLSATKYTCNKKYVKDTIGISYRCYFFRLMKKWTLLLLEVVIQATTLCKMFVVNI